MQLLHRSRISALLIALLALLLPAAATVAQPVPFDPWPSTLGSAGESVHFGPPLCLTWDYLRVQLEAPVRIEHNSQQFHGSVRLEAQTYADRAAQSILLTRFRAISLRADGPAAGSNQELLALVTKALGAWNARAPLESFLKAFVDLKPLASVPISSDAPPIFVSKRPAALLQFDGAPMWLPVEETKISYAVNTNWDVFYDNKSTFYYLLAGDTWLATHDPFSNEWVLPKDLPKDLRRLPHTPDFANVWAHLPYKPNPDTVLPRVIYSEKPAELILLDGEPELEAIPGTALQVVTNTESDLFFHSATMRYYFLVAGRWYSATNLDAFWRNAGTLPPDFAAIPVDHPRAHVLAHVPGTPQAKLEALWAQVPQLARIQRGEANLKVDFAGKPKYVPIDGNRMLWVPNATVPVLALGNDLYACHLAVWFHATSPEGPWTLADQLPADIYTLPPTSPAFRLSFVRLVESDADAVTFGYTGGYENLYVHDGVVVYGTGHAHPPSLQYGAYAYPVYFAQPATHGMGAWYSQRTHNFLRGRPGYGPFGGFGATCRYNSITSHYFRAQTLYGEHNAQQPMLAFLPYTGSYGKVVERFDPYRGWGDAVVAPGDRMPPRKPVTIQAGKPQVTAPVNNAPVPPSKRSQSGSQSLQPPAHPR